MSVAFKEWDVVCDALASGRQTVIIRKGGIHEGRDGFRFSHERFFLFPTKFHAQSDYVREGTYQAQKEWKDGEQILLKYLIVVERAILVTDWNLIKKLEPYHIYTESAVRERYDWEGKGMPSSGLNVAIIRTFRLSEPVIIKYGREYKGCRSWVDIPSESPSPKDLIPVLDDLTHKSQVSNLNTILAGFK